MAKVKIQGNASGTGVLTVTAPNTSTDRTITLPDDTGTLISSTHTGDLTLDVSGDIILDADGGDIFLKDGGTQFGTLRQENGDLTIGTGDTGIRFHDGDNSIYTVNATTGAKLDGAVDLGEAAGRYKDLYLSGGLKVGGTGTANTLEDYEEGTWTPVLGGTSGTSGQAYSIQSGTYTKVGRMCTVSGYLTFTNKGTISSTLQLQGLPFTTANINANIGAVTLARVEGWNLADDHTLCCHVGENGTAGTFTSYAGATSSHSTLTTDHVTNTSSIIFSWTYHTT